MRSLPNGLDQSLVWGAGYLEFGYQLMERFSLILHYLDWGYFTKLESDVNEKQPA
jgi:hypothetical protein